MICTKAELYGNTEDKKLHANEQMKELKRSKKEEPERLKSISTDHLGSTKKAARNMETSSRKRFMSCRTRTRSLRDATRI